MAGLVVAMQVGMWLGYVTFGFVSDSLGRKRAYVAYLVSAAALVLAYGSTRDPRILLVLGATYNVGRIASAAAPFVVGSLAETRGFGTAFPTASVAFVFAAVCWSGIPETRGRILE